MVFFDVINFCDMQGILYLRSQKTSDLVSIKVGGIAALVVYPTTIEQFVSILKLIIKLKFKYYILGNGTNTYFSDNYFDGIIIVTKSINGCYTKGNLIYAECGASLNKCCVLAYESLLSGLEFAYGIPGTVGGALYMNASAFDSSISMRVVNSLVFDKKTLNVYSIDYDKHYFSEKQSVFSNEQNLILLSTIFSLSKSKKECIFELMENYKNKRRKAQPLNLPSAGSVFKKPCNNYASRLIDLAGLKGFKIGGAEVSKKHAGFIVNLGNATSNDVQKLTSYIKETIIKKYNVKLEEEIIFVE